MIDLHGLSEGLLAGIWRTSWQVAVLVVLVLAIQALFSRWLSPRWRYALWLLVVARAFVPVVPQVAGGLVPWEPAPGESIAAVEHGEWTAPALPCGSRRPSASSVAEPEPAAATAVEPESADPDPLGAAAPARPRSGGTGTVVRVDPPPEGSPTVAEPVREARPLPWAAALVVLWLAVMAVLAVRLLLRERRFRRRLAGAEPIRDPALLGVLDECRREVGMRREVSAVVTDLVSTPAAWGVRRPRILLPRRVVADFTPAELRCVLLHELHHLRGPDVLLNGVLAGLRCFYWFHPLVHLAIARARASQETLRDWNALSSTRAPVPVRYAETVLKLLERRPETRDSALAIGFLRNGKNTTKRILMIANFDPKTRRVWTLGAALFVTLGWISFTSAAPEVPLTASPETPVVAEAQEIEVERHVPPPEWWTALSETLKREAAVSVDELELSEIAQLIRDTWEINVVLQRGLPDEQDHSSFTIEMDSISLETLLNIVCRSLDDEVSHCFARGALFIGHEGDLPELMDMRFYRIEPLLEMDDDVDELVALVQMLTSSDTVVWEREGVFVDVWQGLLVVRQTDAVHREVHGFLNRLLRRGVAEEREEDRRRAEIETELADTTLDVNFDDLWIADAAQELTDAIRRMVVVDQWYVDQGETISLNLRSTSAADVLAWMADALETNVLVRDGIVYLTDDAELVLEMYEVGELEELSDYPDDLRDELDWLIRDNIGARIWQGHPWASITFWENLMLVTATPQMHVEIAQLLDSLARAMR